MRRIVLSIFVVGLILSCSPFTKEKYLERYEKFMDEVSQNYSNYSEKQKKDAQNEYNKFNGKWYDKFKEDLSFDEKLKLTGYTIKFNLIKAGSEIGKLYDSYLKKDIDDLKNKIDYYVKNDMEKDLNQIIEEAKKTSEEFYEEVMQLKKEAEENLKK